MTCRHGFLLRAVDMVQEGETYRHVSYLHEWAIQKMGVEMICFDVACNFYDYVKDLGAKDKAFAQYAELLKVILSNWHGKTHAWYCQVKS